MWGERNCLSFETAVGGIEPPSPQLTVRRSTARPPLPTSTYFNCDCRQICRRPCTLPRPCTLEVTVTVYLHQYQLSLPFQKHLLMSANQNQPHGVWNKMLGDFCSLHWDSHWSCIRLLIGAGICVVPTTYVVVTVEVNCYNYIIWLSTLTSFTETTGRGL